MIPQLASTVLRSPDRFSFRRYGPSAAYALRRTAESFGAYPLVRVRRSSDNAETDISFTSSGELDERALMRHCGENAIRRSLDLTNGDSWSQAGVTTSGGVSDPYGGTSAFRVAETTANSEHFLQQFLFPTLATGTYTFRFMVRPNGNSVVHLRLWNQVGSFSVSGVNWTVSGNAITGASVVLDPLFFSPTFAPAANGYWVLTVCLTIPSGSTGQFFRFYTNPQGVYVGDPNRWLDIIEPQIVSGTSVKDFAGTNATALPFQSGLVPTWYEPFRDRHVTQVTASAQPSLVTGGVINRINGRPALTFDGAQQHLFRSDAFMFAQSGVSVATVVQGAAQNDRRIVAEGATTTAAYYGLVQTTANGPHSAVTLRNDNTTVNFGNNNANNVFDNAPKIYGVTDFGGTVATSVNGTLWPAINYSRTGTFTFNRFSIGSLVRAIPSHHFAGSVSEVIITRALTPREMREMQRNQGQYYGMQVAA